MLDCVDSVDTTLTDESQPVMLQYRFQACLYNSYMLEGKKGGNQEVF